MILGFTPTIQLIAAGGIATMALLLFQLASGLRWIKLPPKRRVKIHKTAGIVLVVVAVGHGAMGLILATGLFPG